MAGPYAANTGPGSVLGAQMAVEDFMRAQSRHQGGDRAGGSAAQARRRASIAARLVRNQGVDVITDVPLSSAAFAIGRHGKQKDKVAIFTGAASADVTGGIAGPNHIHWVYDTWSMPHAVVDAAVKEGGDTWFFITADYAFGHSLRRTPRFVTAGRRQGARPGAGAVPRHHRFLRHTWSRRRRAAPR